MRLFASPNALPGAICRLKALIYSLSFAGEGRLPAKSYPQATEQNGIAAIAALAVAALLLAPDIKWALGDQSNWPWDQAYYASEVLKIFRASESGIADWAAAMEFAKEGRPPLMVWVGQLFVPLRHLTGEIESALLLENLLWDGLAVWLVYTISRRLGAGAIESLVALVALGASGIVIALNHQFLVETTQCAAVAFMMFAAFQIEKRSWLAALSLVVIGVVIGVLSKESSIIFIAPLLAYAILVLFITRRRPKLPMRPGDLLLAAAAGSAVVAATAWYWENLFLSIAHVHAATSGDAALNWGSEVHLGPKLAFWTSTLAKALSPFLQVSLAMGAVILLAMVLAAIRFRLTKDRSLIETAIDNGSLFVLTLFGTICAALLAFSLQINEDTRYLISLVPMIAVLLGWALSVLEIRALSAAMLVALAAGGLVNHAVSFGYDLVGVISFNYLGALHNDTARRQLLTAAVQATCHDGNEGQSNVVAVSYSWLSYHTATLTSNKEALRQGSRPCIYLPVNMQERDLAHAIDTIVSMKAKYVITVSAETQHQMEAAGEPKFVNLISLSLMEALARDPRFVRTAESNNTVLIYRPAPEAVAER